MIIVGLPFALLIAVFGPRNPPEGRHETLEKLDEMVGEKAFEKLTYTILKIVFWFVFAIMAVAIVFRYVTTQVSHPNIAKKPLEHRAGEIF